MTDLALVPPPAPEPQLFHPEVKFQLAWDSTSLGVLKECPRKYQYELIYGWRGKNESVHLTFGLLYHAGLEAYDHWCASIGKLDGGLNDEEHKEGVRQCLRRVLKEAGSSTRPTCTACSGIGKVNFGTNTATGEATWEDCDLCKGSGRWGEPVFKTWQSTDPYKNMWTLCRSLVWYLDTFRNSPLRTVTLGNGKPAVEVSFIFPAGDIDGISYSFCGHFDRMVIDTRLSNPEKSVHDRKTTKSQLNNAYWQGFNPHNQFSLYSAASSVYLNEPTTGVTVDAAQILVGSTRFQRQFVAFPAALINEWLTESRVWITLAFRYAQANYWPRNDKACGNYGGCPFRKVCSKSQSFRQDWLEADFTVRKWNPLIQRGDI